MCARGARLRSVHFVRGARLRLRRSASFAAHFARGARYVLAALDYARGARLRSRHSTVLAALDFARGARLCSRRLTSLAALRSRRSTSLAALDCGPRCPRGACWVCLIVVLQPQCLSGLEPPHSWYLLTAPRAIPLGYGHSGRTRCSRRSVTRHYAALARGSPSTRMEVQARIHLPTQ